jgi:hypothetical protein
MPEPKPPVRGKTSPYGFFVKVIVFKSCNQFWICLDVLRRWFLKFDLQEFKNYGWKIYGKNEIIRKSSSYSQFFELLQSTLLNDSFFGSLNYKTAKIPLDSKWLSVLNDFHLSLQSFKIESRMYVEKQQQKFFLQECYFESNFWFSHNYLGPFCIVIPANRFQSTKRNFPTKACKSLRYPNVARKSGR